MHVVIAPESMREKELNSADTLTNKFTEGSIINPHGRAPAPNSGGNGAHTFA